MVGVQSVTAVVWFCPYKSNLALMKEPDLRQLDRLLWPVERAEAREQERET